LILCRAENNETIGASFFLVVDNQRGRIRDESQNTIEIRKKEANDFCKKI